MLHVTQERTTISVVDDSLDQLMFFQDMADLGHFELLGAYTSGHDALIELTHHQPKVAFIDVRLPDICGIECTKRLATLMPQLQIIVITGYPEDSLFIEILRAGAAGLLLKPFTVEETLEAIQAVLTEGVVLSKTALPYLRELIRQLRHSDVSWNLTAREEQLIALLFARKSYKEISTRLKIGFATVHSHMDHLFAKLGVHSRDELIRKFLTS